MYKFQMVLFGILALAVTTLALPANAAYPEKQIEFVIPFGAGGGADIEGRIVADEMSKVLGQPVVAVNKPGGGGTITYTYVKNSKPDGYTVAWNSTSVLTTTNIGNTKFDYDALDHIGQIEYQPMPFVVKADSKWKNLKEFMADCKANPKTLKISIAGIGSATHLTALALTRAGQCQPIILPVKIKRRNSSVLSGEAHAYVGTITGAMNLTKAGKLRILAIPSSKRNDVIPDVPTAKELGYDVTLELFRGLSVAKGTPQAIKDKLAGAMIKAAKSAKFSGLAKKKGFTIETLNVVQFEKKLATEDKLVKKYMKDAGLFKSKTAK